MTTQARNSSSVGLGGWLLLLAAVVVVGGWIRSAGLVAELMNYREDIVYLTGQHIELVAISGSLAIVTGIPLGVFLSRSFFRRYSESAMQVLNIGNTIPTLAVLALSMTFLGIGVVPSIFALWVASLLSIVRSEEHPSELQSLMRLSY